MNEPAESFDNTQPLLQPEESGSEKSHASGLDKIRIVGGKKLNGEISVSGAKNSALKLMCAALLTE